MNAKFTEILNRINPEILESEGVDLVEEEILDSLMIMQIVAMAEGEFDIDFYPDDIVPENFSSPEAMWKMLQKYGVKE